MGATREAGSSLLHLVTTRGIPVLSGINYDESGTPRFSLDGNNFLGKVGLTRRSSASRGKELDQNYVCSTKALYGGPYLDSYFVLCHNRINMVDPGARPRAPLLTGSLLCWQQSIQCPRRRQQAPGESSGLPDQVIASQVGASVDSEVNL
ncbi:hypothetical protein Tco_0756570 [Tanacetum coccineum]